MLLQSMVLSHDTDKVAVLMRAFSRMDIDVVVCSEATSALSLVDRKSFEAVVVEFNVPGADTVLKRIRHHNGNQTIVAAILGGQTRAREAFAMGAKFVLYEPLTLERALQSLRVLKSLMYPQRRRLRKPAYAPVRLRFVPGRELKGVVLNISEGGMAVRLPDVAVVRQRMRARFALPGISDLIEVEGEIAWADKNCRAGIRFVHLPKEIHSQLKQWLFPTQRMTKDAC